MSVRMTAAQFAKLGKPQRFRLKSPRVDLRERDVVKQFCDFLIHRGWRRIRIFPGKFRALRGDYIVSMAEEGTPDLLFYRASEYFFLEAKRNKGGKISNQQLIWQAQAAREGIPVVTLRSLPELLVWYRQNWPTASFVAMLTAF